jgi:hypothetical protein
MMAHPGVVGAMVVFVPRLKPDQRQLEARTVRSTVILPSIALAALLVIAAGGYAIIPGNPVFWCGRIEAFPSLYVVVAAVLAQTGFYLAGAARPYRITQYLAVPFVMAAGLQIAIAYPQTGLALGVLAATIAAVLRISRRRFGTHDLAARIALAIVAFVGLGAAATQIELFGPHLVLSNGFIAISLAVAFVVAVWIAGKAPAGGGETMPFLVRSLPLSLLLLPLLRAKIADTAFDTFMYKGVQPYQMAEWRSGLPAIMDSFMVGTNFQEVINTNLIILLRDYTPSLLSTLSYLLLFLIVPYATATRLPPARMGRAISAFAGLAIFVLPEAAIDQGTSYQEPTMLLMLTASLAPSIAWPAFLAMAAGIKINAAFIAPLVVLFQCSRRGLSGVRWRGIIVGGLLCLLVLVPQFARNVAVSGRLLGLNETLATITDPPGPGQILVPGSTHYDGGIRGGIANHAALSACNMFMLGELCPTVYRGSDHEEGFKMFPASRAPLFAIVLAVALIAAFPRTFTDRVKLLGSVVLFVLCYWITLKYLSEGRYFLPLSFGFGVLLLVNRDVIGALLCRTDRNVWWPRVLAGSAVIMIGSDLIPGVFANAGWACQRSFAGPVQSQPVTAPSTPVETFVASYVARYKLSCPAPGLAPVLMAEPDKLNSPYLGAEVMSNYFAQEMNQRFYAVDPERQSRLATAALVVVYQHDDARTMMLGPAPRDFAQCFRSDDLTVLCSTILHPAGPACARSLVPSR